MARDGSRTPDLSNRTTAIWLTVIFVMAIALRIALSIGPAFDDETGRYLYSGNDPYYHDRTTRHIVETGESLLFDPSINYPAGGNNPNPPIFDWTTAVDVVLLEPVLGSDPVGLSLNLATATWGALTLIPVFVIGASLWGRKAGVWAAFFMGASAPHIQRSVFGFADHDAATMFFIALTFAFMIKALQALKDHEYVASWTNMDHVRTGFKDVFQKNQVAMLYAALAGTAAAGTALVWKGYPYVLAVFAVALGFQLLVDHVRNRDSLGAFMVYMIPMVLVTLLPLPYYSNFPSFMNNTIEAGLYVLYGMLVAGLLLVPTRNLPSILVFPALLVAGLVGLFLMLVVFPDMGRTIFSGLGYFQQNKLYSTIAEAQRAELGFVAANFGFFTFLLAFWGFGRAVKSAYKGRRAMMLMAAWAVVAIFMAFAASRFVMNAAPVFAILAGTVTVSLTGLLNINEVRRRFRTLHGQTNAFVQGMRSLTSRAVVGTLLVVALLVAPNLWIGVDAASPAEFDQERGTDKLGAFGLSFDIKRNGWLEAFNHLATLDQDQPFHERPAFMAWWDYGHWATNLGHHPTVADPFQNNFDTAGRFLASETEDEAFIWLTLLMIHDAQARGEDQDLVATLEDHSSGLSDVLDEPRGHDRFEATAEHIAEGEGYLFFNAVGEAVDKRIGYMGVDSRMYPLSAEQSGIFYAPTFLADKNPDEFVPIVYQTQTGQVLQLQQYEMDDEGLSVRLPQARTVDQQGNEWVVLEGQAWPQGQDPISLGGVQNAGQGTPVQATLQPTQRFHDSMYARAFGDITLAGDASGDGLAHWRTIHESTRDFGGQAEARQVVLLEYYTGYEVSGHVRDQSGTPIAGAQVTFTDGFGASHHQVDTDEDGVFTVLAPFGDDLTFSVSQGDAVIHEEPFTVTRAQADGQVRQEPLDVQIPFGSVTGFAYEDLNGDGSLDADDQVLPGINITLDGLEAQTDSDGRYTFTELQPGGYGLTANITGYQAVEVDLEVVGGEETTQDVAMAPAPSPVTVTFTTDGEPRPGVEVQYSGPENTTVTTNNTGQALSNLPPGQYDVAVDYTFTEDGLEQTFRARKTVEVPFGGDPFSFTIENGEGVD